MSLWPDLSSSCRTSSSSLPRTSPNKNSPVKGQRNFRRRQSSSRSRSPSPVRVRRPLGKRERSRSPPKRVRPVAAAASRSPGPDRRRSGSSPSPSSKRSRDRTGGDTQPPLPSSSPPAAAAPPPKQIKLTLKSSISVSKSKNVLEKLGIDESGEKKSSKDGGSSKSKDKADKHSENGSSSRDSERDKVKKDKKREKEKKSNADRREELLKQLKAVENAIAKKRTRIDTSAKWEVHNIVQAQVYLLTFDQIGRRSERLLKLVLFSSECPEREVNFWHLSLIQSMLAPTFS